MTSNRFIVMKCVKVKEDKTKKNKKPTIEDTKTLYFE
jgi:hypothetical protein